MTEMTTQTPCPHWCTTNHEPPGAAHMRIPSTQDLSVDRLTVALIQDGPTRIIVATNSVTVPDWDPAGDEAVFVDLIDAHDLARVLEVAGDQRTADKIRELLAVIDYPSSRERLAASRERSAATA